MGEEPDGGQLPRLQPLKGWGVGSQEGQRIPRHWSQVLTDGGQSERSGL